MEDRYGRAKQLTVIIKVRVRRRNKKNLVSVIVIFLSQRLLVRSASSCAEPSVVKRRNWCCPQAVLSTRFPFACVLHT